jgi:predicted DNA-binding transcriptional regulator AlpA
MAMKPMTKGSQMRTLPRELIHLLNEHEVAEMLGVSVATVRRWRLLKDGPVYLKLGALCRYPVENVLAWLKSRPCGGGRQELQ